jgi:hypothetical protein
LSALSFGLLGAAALTGACDKGGLKGAEAEVKPHNIKLNLPDVPAFDLPKPNADGSHSVKELRVQGKQYLDSEVSVHGYVTWVYDCATAIRTPEQSDAEVKKMIETDPTKCRRPVFYLGDDAQTPGERSLWVVEVPREMRDYERKNLSKEQKEWQARYDKGVTVDVDGQVVPPYKLGDEVVVTGEWKQASPHGEKATEGLLVYKTLKNITQSWEEPAPKGGAAPGPGGAGGGGGAAPGGPPPATKKKPKGA